MAADRTKGRHARHSNRGAAGSLPKDEPQRGAETCERLPGKLRPTCAPLPDVEKSVPFPL